MPQFLLVRRLGAVVASAAVIAGVVISLRGPYGIPALVTRWSEIRALEQKNADLKTEVDEMRERNRRLREIPSEVEPEIRRLLDMQREGEIDVKIGEPGKPVESPKPAAKP